MSLTVGGVARLERRRKSLALLAFLARHAPAKLRRAELAPLFWPKSPDERARQSLRQALAELRNAVGPALQSTAELVWVDRDAIALDVMLLEDDMDAGRLEEAIARDAGDFLHDCEDVGGAPFRLWLASERARLQRRLAWLDVQLGRPARIETDPPADRSREVAAPAAARTARRTSAPAGALHTSVPLPRLTEQRAVRQALAAAWTRACQGGSEAILLEADAGLGKSHLLEQFVRAARQAQPQSVAFAARALHSERREPGALVRQLLAGAPPSVARLDAGNADPASRLLAAATRVSGMVPLLVAIDDAMLADDASQEAIGLLAQSPPSGTLVLLATRPFMLADVRFRGALQRNPSLQRLSIAPLDTAATADLLRALLPFDEASVPRLAERMCEARRGNPDLIEATVAGMVEDGQLVRGENGTWRPGRTLPGTPPIASDARERARRILPRLSTDARELLEAAAVPGDAVELALVLPMARLHVTAIDVALGELLARRLLRSSLRGDGWLEFTSDGVRSAVLDQLAAARRRALQRAYERALRLRQATAARDRISYERATTGERSALEVLRSTLAAAGLLG